MSGITKDMLLVGSIPLGSTENVLRQCGPLLSDFSPCLPDGETGDRDNWIDFLPLNVYRHHPDVEVVNTPSTGRFSVDVEDYWQVRLKPGASELRFDKMGYADEALRSYEVFTRLRDEGTIGAHVRFQVCLPSTGSGVHMYFRHAEDWPVVEKAYAEGMSRDVHTMLENIPADDLVIQWDVCVEVLDLCGPGLPWAPGGSFEERFERNVAQFDDLSHDIPESILLGFHFCYGTLGGWPMAEFDSLELCVRLANEAVARSGRRVDYVHMPVPRHYDEHFFEPLRDLDIGDTRVYLGVVHHTDGVDDFLARVRDAREFLSDFGTASVCGYGRIPPEQVPQILEHHRVCAEAFTQSVR